MNSIHLNGFISGKAYKLRLKQSSQPLMSVFDRYKGLDNKDYFKTKSESFIGQSERQNNNCEENIMSDENNTAENQSHITNGDGDKCDPKLKEINTENHENDDDYFKNFIDNYKNFETIEPMTGDYKSDSPIGSQKSVLSDKEDIESVINEALRRRQTRFTIEGEISIEKEKKSTGKRRYQIMTICNCSDSESSSDPDPDYDEDSSDSNGSAVSSDDDEILTGLKNAQKKNNEKPKTEQKSECHATKNNERQYDIVDLGELSEPFVKDLTENK